MEEEINTNFTQKQSLIHILRYELPTSLSP